MEELKNIVDEIRRVLRNLQDKTKITLVVMVIFTVTVSGLMFKVFDNPMVEKRREDKETEQILEEREDRLDKEKEDSLERKSKREDKKTKEDTKKEPRF